MANTSSCVTCTHVGLLHLATLKQCRVGGCSCKEFSDPGKPAAEVPSRRVQFDIPEGFALAVTFLPYFEAGGEIEAKPFVVGEQGPEILVPNGVLNGK